MLPIMVVAFCLLLGAPEPPSGNEAEQYEQATKLSHLGRRGESVKMLQGLQSTRAKARLAGLIANDNVTSRLLGITSFDPNLAAKAGERVDTGTPT